MAEGVEYRFRIPLVETDEPGESSFPEVPQSLIDKFQKDGFIVVPSVCSEEGVDALNDHLEDVLRGTYDRGTKPDKFPRLLKSKKPEKVVDANGASVGRKKSSVGPIGFSGNFHNVKVLQIINIHKSDSVFRKLETNYQLGNLVAQLAGWKEGARLAQDQVWAKPPAAPPLVFHRDSPYFMFEPSDVVTVWFALDNMDPELGPLEYVSGSHLWGDGRIGSANQFFQADVKSLLRSAAEREGLDLDSLNIVSMAGLKAGSLSIHNGRIWHGSGKNESKSRPRRGLGLHFVPANVRFTLEASRSSLWKSYVVDIEDPSTVALSEENFPVTSLQSLEST
jgi:ectoine hydroxylase-related dioxygenase (phytanoyl-CoA dioxygenase family)